MNVLVSGAGGFIGSALCPFLTKNGHEVHAITTSQQPIKGIYKQIIVENFSNISSHEKSFSNIDCVIHLAGIPSDILETNKNYTSCNIANTRLTVEFADIAAYRGVTNFIFLSSASVYGQRFPANHIITNKEIPIPGSNYSASKYEAEKNLLEVSKNSNMQVTIIRSPTVYGPGVKSFFYKLMQLVDKNMPIPFGNLSCKRSFIYLENLLDFLLVCLENEHAYGNNFHVSDGRDISLFELTKKMLMEMGSKTKILSLPLPLLKLMIIIAYGKDSASNWLNDKRFDITETKNLLSWKPPFSFDEGLKETINWFVKIKK